MRFSYRLVRDARGYVAECVESDVEGEGKSAKEAVSSLKDALEERMFRPDAVAPPSRPVDETIELVLADEGRETREEEKEVDLGGPGDAPMP